MHIAPPPDPLLEQKQSLNKSKVGREYTFWYLRPKDARRYARQTPVLTREERNRLLPDKKESNREAENTFAPAASFGRSRRDMDWNGAWIETWIKIKDKEQQFARTIRRF